LQLNGSSLVSFGTNVSIACQLAGTVVIKKGGTTLVTFNDGGNYIDTGSGIKLGSDLTLGNSTARRAVIWPTFSLVDGGSHVLEQRGGANAQTFRVYGTFTDASNHVRAALSSTSTAVTLAAETAGTGADDIPLNLTAAGTGTIKVNSVAEVVVSSTVAGLPAAPVVGMLTRVTDATAPVVGMTVAGGGAAAALVWYNGANWSVIGV
jgi:hypothetical protein